MSKLIPLTRGYSAIVDDEDYEFLLQWKWFVLDTGQNTIYAARKGLDENGQRRNVPMHRVVNKTPAGLVTDHRDGNGLNNQKRNLRSATRTQNGRNRSSLNHSGTSAYRGVHWHKSTGKWVASIRVDGRLYHLGLFVTEQDAATCYATRAAEEFGDFCRSDPNE